VPTGVLRAGINLSNFLRVSGRSAAGKPDAVSPDMARAAADRLGVPVQLVPWPRPSVPAVEDTRSRQRLDILQQAIGTARENAAGAAFLRAVVEQAKASGRVAALMARPGVRGLSVAAPA
jgi:polar amino acid transport system substrate-binding protein